MKSIEKIPASGLRLLEILKILTQRPMSTDEMLNIVEQLDGSTYRKEIILKYLNTLKAFGLKIKKEKDKYYLDNGLKELNLDRTDLSILLFIENYTKKLNHENLKKSLSGSLHLIEKEFSFETKKLLKEKNITAYKQDHEIIIQDKEIKKFEHYCQEHQQLEIKYKHDSKSEEAIYKVAPLKIIYKKRNAVFIAYDYKTNLHKEFLIQNITESKQLPQVSTKVMPSIVTYKIKDRLANSYSLKENETLLEKGKDYAIISNKNEDWENLTKRLLRYDSQCEVLYPKEFRDKMINLIEEMEKIYV